MLCHLGCLELGACQGISVLDSYRACCWLWQTGAWKGNAFHAELAFLLQVLCTIPARGLSVKVPSESQVSVPPAIHQLYLKKKCYLGRNLQSSLPTAVRRIPAGITTKNNSHTFG